MKTRAGENRPVVCLDEEFLVIGVCMADYRKGLAVFGFSWEIPAGEYRDICFPIISKLYKRIKDNEPMYFVT